MNGLQFSNSTVRTPDGTTMSQNDMSQLLQNMPAGNEGVRGLLQAYQKGTAELQRLLANEADVILECRVCRSMFRSVINLTTHKKHYCKTKFTAATANSAALWEQFLTTQPQVDQKEDEEDEDTTGKRDKNMLRVIRRRIQEVTVPIPGSKDPLILPTLPSIADATPGSLVGLASSLMAEKNSLRGKTAISFPQDPHARSKALKLRNPKENILTRYSAELPPNELSALHKITRFNPSLIDGTTLKCLHPNCADVPAFKNFMIFGYHCGMKHSSKKDGRACCYLCNHTITKWHNYFNHYTKVHGAVKLLHKTDREEDPEREKTPKKGRRSRSLSPDLTKNDNDEEVEEELEPEEAPPVIEPIDLAETNGNDEDEDEAPPTLTRMSRNRSRNLRAREASLTPVKQVKTEKEDSQVPSRNITPAPIVYRESNRKRIAVVQKAMIWMLDKVQESLGEKVEDPKLDIANVRLFGRKKKLRGRAAYNEKQKQLAKMKKAAEVKAESPEPEEEILEDTPPRTEVDEDISPKEITEERIIKRRKRRATEVVFDESTDLSAPRPSRAKKRPDWMESYLLETDKGKAKGKEEEGGEPTQLSPPITPQKPLQKAASPVDSVRPRGRPLGSYKIRRAREESVDDSPSSSSREPIVMSLGSSRRKQDMVAARDMSEESTVVFWKAGEPASKPYDLSTIPVLLSNFQKNVFFSGLKHMGSDASNARGEAIGSYKCEYCGEVNTSLKEGRRHMVSHLRVHRLLCSLCGAGAFFCADMRNHLQYGGCPNIKNAPFSLNEVTPLMTKGQADVLTNISDPSAPGRVVFTREKIISMADSRPHFPDAKIEEMILGPPRKNRELFPTDAQKSRESYSQI